MTGNDSPSLESAAAVFLNQFLGLWSKERERGVLSGERGEQRTLRHGMTV